MILHDPRSTYRVQPDERSPIAYDLRVPTVVDRVDFRRAIRAAGGKKWSGTIEMLAVLEDGVKAILTEPEDARRIAEYLEAIAVYRANIIAFSVEVSNGTIDTSDNEEFLKAVAERTQAPPLVNDIEHVVEQYYPRYREMCANHLVYPAIVGRVAAKMFLVGWEGIEAEFRRGRDGVPNDLLGHIPSQHLLMIGAEIERLLEPTTDRLRPLPLPSGSQPDPPASNGTEPPPEKTRSPTTGGTARSSTSPN